MLDSPMLADSLSDQYAFRPTGSTTAALIAILSDLTHLTNGHPYVHVIGLDFNKVFDTVRYSTLMQKLAAFPLDNKVYTTGSWIIYATELTVPRYKESFHPQSLSVLALYRALPSGQLHLY